jgi:hypothetical protein
VASQSAFPRRSVHPTSCISERKLAVYVRQLCCHPGGFMQPASRPATRPITAALSTEVQLVQISTRPAHRSATVGSMQCLQPSSSDVAKCVVVLSLSFISALPVASGATDVITVEVYDEDMGLVKQATVTSGFPAGIKSTVKLILQDAPSRIGYITVRRPLSRRTRELCFDTDSFVYVPDRFQW